MAVLISILCVFATTGVVMFMGTHDFGTSAKLIIVPPMVFLSVYCLARIPRKEKGAYAKRSAIVKFFDRGESASAAQIDKPASDMDRTPSGSEASAS